MIDYSAEDQIQCLMHAKHAVHVAEWRLQWQVEKAASASCECVPLARAMAHVNFQSHWELTLILVAELASVSYSQSVSLPWVSRPGSLSYPAWHLALPPSFYPGQRKPAGFMGGVLASFPPCRVSSALFLVPGTGSA